MNIKIGPKDINEHIEKVVSLLKKQNYIPQAVVLTTQERGKLHGLLYSYDQYGSEERIFDRYYYLKTQEDVDKLNKKVFENADEETRAIIVKCGVDPQKLFFVDEMGCVINEQLYHSMEAFGIAKVSGYTIEFTRGHPIDRESAEIKSFREEVQQEKFDRYKDGEATFRVFCEIAGEKKQIYYHSEGMHFGEHISFMNEQIGGNFGMGGYRFSGFSEMMKMDEGIANSINSLMPFFESFEEALSQEIINNNDTLNTAEEIDSNTLNNGGARTKRF